MALLIYAYKIIIREILVDIAIYFILFGEMNRVTIERLNKNGVCTT